MTGSGAATRLCGVVGHPVGHSLSPAIHTAALRHDGIDAVYLAFDLSAQMLATGLAGLAALGAVGVNVTVPHKLAVLEAATSRGSEVDEAGAANLLLFRGGEVEARNTDVEGFRRAFVELAGAMEGKRVLLLGAGGAARAAASALAAGGARIEIANRTASRARSLVDELSSRGASARLVPWAKLEDELPTADALVNATSVGLLDDAMPVSPRCLELASVGGCGVVLDLVYTPAETALVREARRLGLVAADGLAMLVHQAAEAYELLWDHPPPAEVMARAARRAAGRPEAPSGAARPFF